MHEKVRIDILHLTTIVMWKCYITDTTTKSYLASSSSKPPQKIGWSSLSRAEEWTDLRKRMQKSPWQRVFPVLFYETASRISTAPNQSSKDKDMANKSWVILTFDELGPPMLCRARACSGQPFNQKMSWVSRADISRIIRLFLEKWAVITFLAGFIDPPTQFHIVIAS